MSEDVTVTTITDDQIERAVIGLREALCENRNIIPSDIAQMILNTKNIGLIMFESFRECVKLNSKIIFQDVTTKHNPSHGDEAGVVKLAFFKIDLKKYGEWISEDELENEYRLRCLRPADHNLITTFDKLYPDFSKEKPFGTHWKNNDGCWCHAEPSFVERVNEVHTSPNHGWGKHKWAVDFWWFAGVRDE